MISDRTDALRKVHEKHVARPEKPAAASSLRPSPYIGTGTKDANFSDAEVLALCRKARNAPKFERLYDRGDTAEYGGDDNRADLALVGILVFYTQDRGQLDRLFRGGALNREKWEGRPDYRDRTIDAALAEVRETYSPPGEAVRISPNGHREPASRVPASKGTGTQGRKPEVVRLGEVERPGPRRYLWDGLVPAGYTTLFHGDGGVAKSMLALALGSATAEDRASWLGRGIHGAPVLYLDFELTAEEQARRVWQLCQGAGLARPPEDLLYLSAVGCRAYEAFEVARGACEEHGAGLLILDSLGPALQGDAEASRDVIGFYNASVEPFREMGVAVVIVDHQSKLQAGQSYQSKGAFGSVYKANLARSVVQVEATERGEGTLTVRLRQKKHNFGPLADPFGVMLAFSEESVSLEPVELDATELAEEGTLNAADRVKLALEQGPAYPWEIADFTGLAQKTVKNALTGLRKQGVAEPTGVVDGRAEQVRLIVPASPSPYRDRDAGTILEPPSDDSRPGGSSAVTEPEAQCSSSPSEDVRKLLKDPPDGLRRQIEHARGQGFPERLLGPLAAAVATEVLGDGTRGAEVLSAVEAFLTHGVGCDCGECA